MSGLPDIGIKQPKSAKADLGVARLEQTSRVYPTCALNELISGKPRSVAAPSFETHCCAMLLRMRAEKSRNLNDLRRVVGKEIQQMNLSDETPRAKDQCSFNTHLNMTRVHAR